MRPVQVDRRQVRVVACSHAHHLLKPRRTSTVLQRQHGHLAQLPLGLVSLGDHAAKQLASKVAVQIHAIAQLVQHVILPGQCHHRAQLDVGRVTHQHRVSGRGHQRIAQTSGRTTGRDVLPVDRVATRIPASCLGAPEVQVHRQRATTRRLHEAHRTGLGDGRLDAQSSGHKVLHVAVLVVQQVGEVLVALGERVGLLLRVGFALLARRHHTQLLQRLGELVVGHDHVAVGLGQLQQLFLALDLGVVQPLHHRLITHQHGLGEHAHRHVDELDGQRWGVRVESLAQLLAQPRVMVAILGVLG